MADLKPLKVRFLGKDYTLRVQEDDELATLEMAEYLDSRMRAFKQAHPEQSDLTAAVITGLSITEEVFVERSSTLDPGEHVNAELNKMERKLSRALLSK
ncbi:MAG: cell division protein ZapA [Bacteroidetes Order II. Incertae sedis bacterium]|jgi:cell division protein ZapA|nr:cell division protein ZapA [Bacteroidetes Order II. bacterium]MBT4053441.1 cell division protein ZapA [Bacteroidetes Order II. bacterium]MBT4601782.1 cell division protein ZapA [Bacteroidetes Order II. bacterium]MBT5250103.1 cell division protein ZapA [Bacteroidetes Order II. bacterium]MBT6201831.1 cell division protein ZapA [Bacteroidetes Order II. bacterium]